MAQTDLRLAASFRHPPGEQLLAAVFDRRRPEKRPASEYESPKYPIRCPQCLLPINEIDRLAPTLAEIRHPCALSFTKFTTNTNNSNRESVREHALEQPGVARSRNQRTRRLFIPMITG
jgi:hypothetical protein